MSAVYSFKNKYIECSLCQTSHFLFLTNFHRSGSSGLDRADMILFRIYTKETDVKLPGDYMEEGQLLELEGDVQKRIYHLLKNMSMNKVHCFALY